MVQGIKYTTEYQVDCNKISIDLLESLDRYLLEKGIIPQNIFKSYVSFEYENCTMRTDSLSELFNKEQFILNFDKDFSISLVYYECKLKSYIYLSIKKTKEKTTFKGTIQNREEHIAIGHKEVLEKFLKDNFIEEKVVEQERNDNDKQAENKTAIRTIKKKSLEWDIPSIKLTLEDLHEIEFILKQDLIDIKKYEINVEPNKKYLQKRTNAPKYTFNSVSEFKEHNDLLKNIKNYSIKFELRTTEISVNFEFSNENNFLDKLYADGKNQTLYYGTYKLLTDYLNTKKNWYYLIYNYKFSILMSLLILFCYLLYIAVFLETQDLRNAVSCLIYFFSIVLLYYLTPKILIKHNIQLKQNNKFWESSTFQFFIFVILNLITIVLTIIK